MEKREEVLNRFEIYKRFEIYTDEELFRVIRLLEGFDRVEIVDSTATASRHLGRLIAGHQEERFGILCLDGGGKVLDNRILTIGSEVMGIVDIVQVLRHALQQVGCYSIVVGHNHPTGRLEASEIDKDITRRLRIACDTVGIRLLDHIIFGLGDSYISIRGKYGI